MLRSNKSMLSNLHFHNINKGCDIEEVKTFKHYKTKVLGAYCKTHEIKLCRCGWEIGWHHGVFSPELEGAQWQVFRSKLPRPLTIPFEGFKIMKKIKTRIKDKEIKKMLSKGLDKCSKRLNN